MKKWHYNFNPKNFLSSVDVNDLIKRSNIKQEKIVTEVNKDCFFCSSYNSPGFFLNDSSYLCNNCYDIISTITYPEFYEKRYREYISDKEAHELAYNALLDKYDYSKIISTLYVISFFTFPLFAVRIYLISIPILSLIFSLLLKHHSKKRIKIWKGNFAEPVKPNLLHFHDPNAILSLRDEKILQVFNNWPDYPPFWSYLKSIVVKRDNHHCQVSGCPSRVSLHIHHKIPKAKGGQHVPDNLITLCSFHHGLEPDIGHEGIWSNIKNEFFTMVRSHYRQNRVKNGYHIVKAHVRRLSLVSLDDILDLNDYYKFSCSSCNSYNLGFKVCDNAVFITCKNCREEWSFVQKLTEEVGPKIAEVLIVNQNQGSWKPRWDMLSTRI